MPLHGGRVPRWLADRMTKLGSAITEAIVIEYGRDMFLKKLSDPFWFQSFGCVLGMDWHSSGITTSVMNALKRGLNPMAGELGIYICGGRGKHSLKTPDELLELAEKTGLNGYELVKKSKLAAKVDNTAIQDGHNIYLHNFIVTHDGHWTIVQQGMNALTGMARRYHWNSTHLASFVTEPHTAVCGKNKGLILNLAASEADGTKKALVDIVSQNPGKSFQEVKKVLMPRHHDVRAKDVDLKRLGAVLALAYESNIKTFDELLLIQGLGPRTLQSLTLVSEVIHGTPSRFKDPARFSFAHGGKDGHPFPVPLKVYDQSIHILKTSIERAKIDRSEKQGALKGLHTTALRLEKGFEPTPGNFDKVIQQERKNAYKYGGMTVTGPAKPPRGQLSLF